MIGHQESQWPGGVLPDSREKRLSAVKKHLLKKENFRKISILSLILQSWPAAVFSAAGRGLAAEFGTRLLLVYSA